MAYLQRLAAFNERELAMHSKQFLAVAIMAILMSAGTAAWAQNSTVNKTPGHMMQDPKANDTGPGASEYAPGHKP